MRLDPKLVHTSVAEAMKGVLGTDPAVSPVNTTPLAEQRDGARHRAEMFPRRVAIVLVVAIVAQAPLVVTK